MLAILEILLGVLALVGPAVAVVAWLAQDIGKAEPRPISLKLPPNHNLSIL